MVTKSALELYAWTANCHMLSYANSFITAITQGSTIGLQALYDKRNWLSCGLGHGPLCGKAGCPALYMDTHNWNDCYGEVFQIYRFAGPGDVQVGDIVGIYYPKTSKWYSLAGSQADLDACPGQPNKATGFADQFRWFRCYGEVFSIYAYGKNVGDTINDHDHVMLLYVRDQNWASLADPVSNHDGCPGTTFPPAPDRYDQCWGEVFEIWKKP